MQGTAPSGNSDDSTTIIDYIKDVISKSTPPQEFLDIANISVPKEKSEVKDRIESNFEKYKGNYLVVLGFFIFIFVVLNSSLIPLILVWGLVFYSFKKGENVLTVRNYTIRKDYVLKGCGVFTVIYLLFFYNSVLSLMTSICFFTIACLAHMIFFYDKEDENDDENEEI